LTGFLKPGRTDPNTVPVQVEVPRRVYRRAMELTGAYASMSLGQVLERWVEDAAHAARHLDSWEHKQLARWLRGHPFPKETRPHHKHRARRQPETL
jgi:hypothetical protein